jgi:ribonuclease III
MLDEKTLCEKIGYFFEDSKLLQAALTHRSVRGKNNERLEFFGDSVLNFLIAEELYQRCPNADEGELSRLRSILVKGDTLADLGREFELGQYLRLGVGEKKSGGCQRTSILADGIEALIAAIYFDSSIEICRECVLNWYSDRLNHLDELSVIKDPKTRLQEYLQSHRVDLPVYRVVSIEGKAHSQTFVVECDVEILEKRTEGKGRSRRRAEQEAAAKLLEQLEK